MATVGSLIVEFQANTAAITRDVGKVRALIESSSANMNKAIASVERGIRMMAGALSVVAVAGFAKSLINEADALGEMSQKLGVSVENLSAYSYGAKQAGSSTEEMNTSLTRLSKNIQEAVVDKTSEAARTFSSLGISLKDASGKLKSTDAIFEELANRFSQSADGPEKVAVAMKLLGKSGADLIPLMNDLAAFKEEATKAGAVISTDFAKASDNFNDGMAKMWESTKRLSRAVVGEFLPGINMMIERLNVATGAQESLSLETLERDRAALMAHYMALRNAGLKTNTAEAQALEKRLHDLDSKIIAANKRILETQDKIKDAPKLTTGISDKEIAELERAAKAIKEQVDPVYQLNTQWALYDKLLMRGMITEGQWADATTAAYEKFLKDIGQAKEEMVDLGDVSYEAFAGIQSVSNPLRDLGKEWLDTSKQMRDATVSWAQDSADAITEFAMTGKFDFKEMADSIIRDLIRIQVQRALAGFIGTITTTAAAPAARAEGGPVSAGSTYMVGEKGVEMFTPRQSGYIVPNDKIKSSSNKQTVNLTVNVQTGVQQTVRAEMIQLMPRITEQVKVAVADASKRGGSFSDSFN